MHRLKLLVVAVPFPVFTDLFDQAKDLDELMHWKSTVSDKLDDPVRENATMRQLHNPHQQCRHVLN
jgi:hypothetical protein